MAAAKRAMAFLLTLFPGLLSRRTAKNTRKTSEKKSALSGRMRKAIPQLIPAATPSPREGLRRDRKRNKRKSVLKNRLAVWDIMVEDISRNQGEIVARRAARRPTDRLEISAPRRKKRTIVKP